MKIEELRARAEKALGGKFDRAGLHDAVLGQGSVPMDALEAQIDPGSRRKSTPIDLLPSLLLGRGVRGDRFGRTRRGPA